MKGLRRIQDRLAKDPDAMLFSDQEQTLSVRQFFARTQAFKALLESDGGVRSGDNVALYLPRGANAAAAIYAVLQCGARYVPLDTNNSDERLRFILKDSRCRCVVGASGPAQWSNVSSAVWLDASSMDGASLPVVDGFDSEPEDSEELAAILYTSGSTGTPKGVAISHRAMDAFCDWIQASFSLNQTDRIASLAPFHFDLSLFDLFCGPANGASTFFIPDALTLAPAKLAAWLARHAITTWYTVPSILGFLSLKGGLESKPMAHLRRILFAGEVFPTPRLMRLANALPQVEFYNLFGPTETNVCLSWRVDRNRLAPDAAIPVGSPACDAEIRIDPEQGELLVKGPCLMSGYWADGIVDLPLDDAGWFYTGDKVSLNAEGLLAYHGRLDRMIKRSGYRIEPAEIEKVINATGNVVASAVVTVPDAVQGSRIIAFVAGAEVAERAVRAEVQKRLPPYMRPSAFHIIEQMPVLANGKTDYQRLTRMVEELS